MESLKLLPVFFFLWSSLCRFSLSSTDSFLYGGCSQLKYTGDQTFEANLNSLLTSIVNSASYVAYDNFTIAAGGGHVSGLYQCRGDLPTSDCAACVRRCVTQLGNLCLDATGGTLQMEGCYVRYDNMSFIGSEDKTLVLKKCGPDTRYDTDVLSRRDELLGGLAASTGAFRVGSASYVKGMSQCVGDLAPPACSDCVSQAAETIKGVCPGSISGEVYLAKCYARFALGETNSEAANGGRRTRRSWILALASAALDLLLSS